MAKPTYDDLIFALGDLARERLANKPGAPRTMDRVFKAEDGVIARREELAAIEVDMNDEDAAYQDFIEQQDAEEAEQLEIVKKWKRAVEGIEGRSRDMRKKISTWKATMRYEKLSLKTAEEKHRDFEMASGHEVEKIAVSAAVLKKTRLNLMRRQRDIEELELEFQTLLTPRPGQPGAQGILAHRRILEMEDEAEERKAGHTERMKALEEEIVVKEEELKAAEEYLDQAVFLLGEDCYQKRIADPAMAALYPKLDQVK
jgi:hypothetical protein